VILAVHEDEGVEIATLQEWGSTMETRGTVSRDGKMFILPFLIVHGTLATALLGPWMYRKMRSRMAARAGARSTEAEPKENRNLVTDRLKRLSKVVLAILSAAILGVTPLHAEFQRTMVNLRGDQVFVPGDVPPKERFVFRRMISVDDRLIVFLYSDPRFRRPVDYAETYNLVGELLEVAWYESTEGLRRARDINLGNPKATGPARVLEMFLGAGDGI
jgi:hypothetical protein